MCRLLFVKSTENIEIESHLRAFAAISKSSSEYQGHGWGAAYLDDKMEWKIYRNIRPVWEDNLSQFGSTKLLIAHARSAFRNMGISVKNNMPFTNGSDVFIFNGELHGVKVKSEGGTGAEKIFNYILRFDKGDLELAVKKAVKIICERSKRIRAMNMIIGDNERMVLCSMFREDNDYFTMYKKEDKNLFVICSDRYPAEENWIPIENNTIEAI